MNKTPWPEEAPEQTRAIVRGPDCRQCDRGTLSRWPAAMEFGQGNWTS